MFHLLSDILFDGGLGLALSIALQLCVTVWTVNGSVKGSCQSLTNSVDYGPIHTDTLFGLNVHMNPVNALT